MSEYEVVHEIFNLCSGNQMRDVFIEEIEIPDGAFEEYIRSRHKEKDILLESGIVILIKLQQPGLRWLSNMNLEYILQISIQKYQKQCYGLEKTAGRLLETEKVMSFHFSLS